MASLSFRYEYESSCLLLIVANKRARSFAVENAETGVPASRTVIWRQLQHKKSTVGVDNGPLYAVPRAVRRCTFHLDLGYATEGVMSLMVPNPDTFGISLTCHRAKRSQLDGSVLSGG
ncbi:hypothetical protein PISMIDRAFT_689290 [Pisolithus microcarpus 441]|uniref:Uncharacterized protein n=1 Tax=Pisolithus microcarpus 441 TaxID=765257 RepID=A0A0C9YXJ6_9AGAM|nr:hypothetical protein PISMIDRAFT_689290 [Pisolithus microcarpus 441]